MKTYTVDVNNPPHRRRSTQYWERSKDPYHPKAYAKLPWVSWWRTFFTSIGNPRKEGWAGIDYAENMMAFVPDGSVEDGEVPEYIFKVGPFGHVCAYDPDDLDRMNTHAQWIAEKEK
jgi:hypothetical protein